MGKHSKSGFTLIELVVYIAIMSFIIVVAGRVFSDSTSMRVRSQNLLKSSSEIGKLSNLLTEDISQMGVKAWGSITTCETKDNYDNCYRVISHNKVYMNADNIVSNLRDSSSYILVRRKINDRFADSLVFRKAVFDKDGKFIAVHEIALYTSRNGDRDSLFRKCREVDRICPQEAPEPSKFCLTNTTQYNDCPSKSNINDAPKVLMATDITNFKLTPSTTGQEVPLFDDQFGLYSPLPSGDLKRPGKCENNNTETKVSEFISNYAGDNNPPSGNAKHELYLSDKLSQNCETWTNLDCKEMTFGGQKTYVVEFKMPFNNDESTQFQPSRDHLSIGLRNKQGTKVDGAPADVLFYPPQDIASRDMVRHIEFPIKKKKEESIKACVAITMAFYSPTASNGELTFEGFKVFRKTDESFDFPESDVASFGICEPTGNCTTEQKIKERRSVKAFELMVEMAIGKEERKSGTFSQKGRGIIVATPNNGVSVTVEE